MFSVDRMVHLANKSSFDSMGENTTIRMDRVDLNVDKLGTLGAGTRYDICTSSGCSEVRGICHSFTHDGRCISLFKTLYTNYCSHECNYCVNASGSRGSKIFSYTPEELARLTLQLYRSNYIEGLFLSSGAGKDEDQIMERLIETASLLRNRYNFSGYIHLKILPGSSISHIRQAMELSTRVSVNLEAPSASHMREMSATKDYNNDILQRQRYIKDLAKVMNLPAGQTTQLVVGAGNESDREIFRRVLCEYEEMEIKRAYYSSFCPIEGTAFASKEPQPLWREHRLYQIDWLYRIYHLKPNEIEHAFDDEGFLSNSDPKETIAAHLIDLPVDPNMASYKDLIRVPGIGPTSARRIIAFRRRQRISNRKELSNLGARMKRAAPFLKINGWRDTTLDRWSA